MDQVSDLPKNESRNKLRCRGWGGELREAKSVLDSIGRKKITRRKNY